MEWKGWRIILGLHVYDIFTRLTITSHVEHRLNLQLSGTDLDHSSTKPLHTQHMHQRINLFLRQLHGTGSDRQVCGC